MTSKEALDEAKRSIDQHLYSLLADASEPTHLFHYTSTAGLVSIVTSKTLYASDILSMSDQSEFHHGAELARRVIRELHSTKPRAVTESVLHTFEKNGMLGVGTLFFFYAICFCAGSDVLSQWQSFSASGGCALGLDFQKIRKAESERRLMLAKMVYDQAVQEQMVKDVVNNAAALFDQFERFLKADECANEFIFWLGVALYNLISRFKHPCFSAENEWRIIVAGSPEESAVRVKYRAVGKLVRPYWELPLDLDWITNIVRSPGTWPANQRYAVERLARGIGKDILVEDSQLPFVGQ